LTGLLATFAELDDDVALMALTVDSLRAATTTQ
jgi:hypothetical protein